MNDLHLDLVLRIAESGVIPQFANEEIESKRRLGDQPKVMETGFESRPS